MGERTGIEWTHHTFNPWIGCTRVSEGCKHCYAETLAARYGWAKWGPGQPRKHTAPATWAQPRAWDRKAKAAGRMEFVFCASLADVLDPEVPDDWRCDLQDLIEATPNLTWLLLTKRPEGYARLWPKRAQPDLNVWWGTSIENQDAWDARRKHLRAIPAVRRFLSLEPLLGPVEFGEKGLEGINWAIVGGETGPRDSRLINPQWVRRIHKQCGDAGVDFFMKKWGNVAPKGQRDGFLDGYEIRERPAP